MKRQMLFPLVTASLLGTCSALHAQQAASASFPSARPATSTSATVTFPRSAPSTRVSECAVSNLVCGQDPVAPPAKKVIRVKKPAPFDPLALHPEVAVRDTKAKEIVLPGVMRIDGTNAHALDPTRAREIEMTNGGAQVVYVSQVDQNRIQLPWANPKVNGTNEISVDKSATSNNVYIQFNEGVSRTVTVYFEEPGTNVALALQLVPKRVPGQTIIVKDNRRTAAGTLKAQRSNDYVSLHQSLAETAAMGLAPLTFSEADLRLQPIVLNGLIVQPKKQYSSGERDIFVYEVHNPGPNKATLREQEFDGDRVLAVSIFPKSILGANESAKVIVIAGKQKEL